MTNYIASSDVHELFVGPEIGGGRDAADDEVLPDGIYHAAEPGAPRTACGTPVAWLHPFPQQPWGLGLAADVCARCSRIVPWSA